jgi:hypothetical protein
MALRARSKRGAPHGSTAIHREKRSRSSAVQPVTVNSRQARTAYTKRVSSPIPCSIPKNNGTWASQASALRLQFVDGSDLVRTSKPEHCRVIHHRDSYLTGVHATGWYRWHHVVDEGQRWFGMARQLPSKGRQDNHAPEAHQDCRNAFRQSALGILDRPYVLRLTRSDGHQTAPANTVWRRGRDSNTAISAIYLRSLHFRDNSVRFKRLQDISILGYSFYSFSYSLQFHGNWYQWYQ